MRDSSFQRISGVTHGVMLDGDLCGEYRGVLDFE